MRDVMYVNSKELIFVFTVSVIGAVAVSSPVVLVPGDGASVLETKFDKPIVPHFFCAKSTHGVWQTLWVPPRSQFVPGRIDCWTDTMRLRFNSTSIGNGAGIEIRAVPGEAGLQLKVGNKVDNVYADLIQFIKKELRSDVTVATYDFRLSPAANPQFVTEMKDMVEEAYRRSGQQKATLISHSFGSLWTHYLLTRAVDTTWKERYIHAWISISPAYGGAVVDLVQLVSGFSSGIPWLKPTDLIDEQRSYESNLWLLPPQQIYGDEPLVRLTVHEDDGGDRVQNYNASNYYDLFEQAGYTDFPILWNRVKDLTAWEEDEKDGIMILKDPGVHVFPIYGNGVETPLGYDYDGSFSSEPVARTTTDGDNTLTLQCLTAGNAWSGSQPLQIDGAGHNSILNFNQTRDRVKLVLNVGSGMTLTTSLH